MIEKIETDELRQWLEQQRAVIVLDVRAEVDRQQWSIPGSIHADVYEALKANQRTALSDMEFPDGVPVVAVCGAGKMSERAAEELGARNIRALSLTGGMKAWSLSWNVAATDFGGTRVLQIRRTGKGCLSYMACSDGEALVIDASLPVEIYLDLAKQNSVVIRYVADTHIHADHLSRSRELARLAGAELLLPPQPRARFSFRPWPDNEVLNVGSARLRAIGTPGHTMESCSYYLESGALFSGDTLFPASVGRPDLHAGTAESTRRAELLFDSIRRLLDLPGDTHLCPGHTSVPTPFDGIFLSTPLWKVPERLDNWLNSRGSFVERILARIPPTPPNYERIVELNEFGTGPEGDPTDLEAGANRCAVG
jgi:glyoxylase-like metal-dependent hydrolase (beta-lactamase superfamily II)